MVNSRPEAWWSGLPADALLKDQILRLAADVQCRPVALKYPLQHQETDLRLPAVIEGQRTRRRIGRGGGGSRRRLPEVEDLRYDALLSDKQGQTHEKDDKLHADCRK